MPILGGDFTSRMRGGGVIRAHIGGGGGASGPYQGPHTKPPSSARECGQKAVKVAGSRRGRSLMRTSQPDHGPPPPFPPMRDGTSTQLQPSPRPKCGTCTEQSHPSRKQETCSTPGSANPTHPPPGSATRGPGNAKKTCMVQRWRRRIRKSLMSM